MRLPPFVSWVRSSASNFGGTVLVKSKARIGFPRVSPQGDRVAFLDWPVKNDDRGTVVMSISKATGDRVADVGRRAKSGVERGRR